MGMSTEDDAMDSFREPLERLLKEGDERMSDRNLVERRAVFVYETARLEARCANRPIVPEAWIARDQEFCLQFCDTIERICADGYTTTPEREHESWMAAYHAMGWRYGPVRDVMAKTHPDMVSYWKLSEAEREKDEVFLALCDIARRFIR